jgi:DNA-binding protein H-NS
MSEVIEQIDLSSYSIEELKELVDKAKKEVATKEQNRVQQIRNQIEQLAGELDMTVEELMHYDGRRKPKVGVKPVGKIKFQNPANPNQTWTGRGKRPRWLQDALDEGANLEEFALSK